MRKPYSLKFMHKWCALPLILPIQNPQLANVFFFFKSNKCVSVAMNNAYFWNGKFTTSSTRAWSKVVVVCFYTFDFGLAKSANLSTQPNWISSECDIGNVQRDARLTRLIIWTLSSLKSSAHATCILNELAQAIDIFKHTGKQHSTPAVSQLNENQTKKITTGIWMRL